MGEEAQTDLRLAILEHKVARLELLGIRGLGNMETLPPGRRPNIANNAALYVPPDMPMPEIDTGVDVSEDDYITINERRIRIRDFIEEVNGNYAERDQKIEELEARLRSADAHAENLTSLLEIRNAG